MLQIMTPGVIKISILLLYLRLFSAKHTLKRVIYGLIAFVAAYVLAFEISLVLSCKPVKTLFRPARRRRYHNIKYHVLVQACVNVLSDLLVLLVPIPTVLQLHLSKQRRIAVLVIFIVASMCENLTIPCHI
jgi:chromate transport protein ChrA